MIAQGIKMKFYKRSLLAIAAASVFSTQTLADSWWDKATDFIKQSSDSSESSTEASGQSSLAVSEIADAFKQALKIGSEKVVSQLGQTDGFNADPKIHIPLPSELQKVKSVLDKVGMGHLADDLELKLNRAAEAATPKAKALFIQAIQEMSFNDVREIYEGEKDSATQFFKQKMSTQLSAEMKPIVDDTIAQVGAVQALDKLIGEYKDLPFVSRVKTDISDHVVNKGMEGIFHYIAQEEVAIRESPSQRTTDLLKKVFGL